MAITHDNKHTSRENLLGEYRNTPIQSTQLHLDEVNCAAFSMVLLNYDNKA